MALQLSKHFTLDEATITQVRDVSNQPPTGILAVMGLTAEKMEQVRTLLGFPIHVNSWYRSPAVNAKVGGAKKSAHMEGRAVDFICPHYGTPYEICKFLESKKAEIGFDQLIYEHTWVHIGFVIPPAAPRLEVLTLGPNGSYMNGVVFNPLKGK